ncbi:MAG TPA: hypothetical protein DDX14_05650 [Cyanobacteria bacterium UBA9579]|nr:hypothetical protein [Cyanobacteria bacterium UBA9579]
MNINFPEIMAGCNSRKASIAKDGASSNYSVKQDADSNNTAYPIIFTGTNVKYTAKNSQKTQIKSTQNTYKKLAQILKERFRDYDSLDKLDYGAGLGHSKTILGAETYEPYARGYKPDYVKPGDITKKYDIITNLYVLNVIKDLKTRNNVVKHIGELLKPGGEAYISVRPKTDVDAIKSGIPCGDGVLTSIGTFQKGFTSIELQEYVKHILGDGYKVEKTKFSSGVDVVVTKSKEIEPAKKVKKYSIPPRSKEYGVGKVMGSQVYLHKEYENVLKNDGLNLAKSSIPADFTYDIICYDKKDKSFSFISSPDFNTANEPVRGDAYKVKPSETVKYVKPPKDPLIYHHKWLFVKDDYAGFDVEASKKRSEHWTSLDNIDSSRIGRKSYWEKHKIPKITAKE